MKPGNDKPLTLASLTPEELADLESPELTDEEIASLRPAREALSRELYAALTKRKPGQRGPQKAPTKEMLTLRIDRDVVAAFRESGPGWQARINDTLRAAILPSPVRERGTRN